MIIPVTISFTCPTCLEYGQVWGVEMGFSREKSEAWTMCVHCNTIYRAVNPNVVREVQNYDEEDN